MLTLAGVQVMPFPLASIGLLMLMTNGVVDLVAVHENVPLDVLAEQVAAEDGMMESTMFARGLPFNVSVPLIVYVAGVVLVTGTTAAMNSEAIGMVILSAVTLSALFDWPVGIPQAAVPLIPHLLSKGFEYLTRCGNV